MKLTSLDYAGFAAFCVMIACMLILSGCEVPNSNHKQEVATTTVEVIAFTAKYCGPCKPAVAALRACNIQGTRNTKVLVTVIDILDHPDIAKEYKVSATPTFIVRVDSRTISRTNDVLVAVSAARKYIR